MIIDDDGFITCYWCRSVERKVKLSRAVCFCSPIKNKQRDMLTERGVYLILDWFLYKELTETEKKFFIKDLPAPISPRWAFSFELLKTLQFSRRQKTPWGGKFFCSLINKKNLLLLLHVVSSIAAEKKELFRENKQFIGASKVFDQAVLETVANEMRQLFTTEGELTEKGVVLRAISTLQGGIENDSY